MSKSRFTTQLTIAGMSVEVTHENVPLDSLRLDPDNPRIRLQMDMVRKKPKTPDELMALMREQNGYDALQRQIRIDGGISDPLMVRHDGRIVEGNTRFTVLSVLSKTPGGTKKWGMVPVTRLPPDVPEKVIQLQMAGYHVSGKSGWRPSAQAAHMCMLLEQGGASMEEVATITRMSPKKVQQHIDAYKYLVHEVIPELEGASAAEKQEILESKFNHAKEFISRRTLQPMREDAGARKDVAKMIAEGQLTGMQVRDLDKVFEHPPARAALERKGIDEAKEVLRKADPTGGSKLLKAIAKVSESLENLDQKDLELFRGEAKARDALQRVIAAAESILALTTVKGKRRA